MSDDLVQDWRVQASFKFPPGAGYDANMVNVRADDFDELGELLSQVTGDLAGKISSAAALLGTASGVATSLGGENAVTSVSTQGTTTSNNGGAPQCAHGVRVFRKAKPGKGDWQAFFCNTPQNFSGQKCDPIFKGKENEDEPYWP